MMNSISKFALSAFFLGSSSSIAAVLSGGPDGWDRGVTTDSVYFGWDDFEDSGIPGTPFGSILNDSSPDVGSFAGTASIAQDNTFPGSYGNRSGSGNIYSGFTGQSLDLTVAFSSFGTVGSGSTTIYLSILGNPADDRMLETFSLSDGTNTFTPNISLTGLSAEDPGDTGARAWLAEWQLTGHAANYFLSIDSDLASGFGVDVGIDSITVDAVWTASSTALASTSVTGTADQNRLGTNVVPEPSTAILALGGVMLAFRRRRG